jgi:hypothetical protein
VPLPIIHSNRKPFKRKHDMHIKEVKIRMGRTSRKTEEEDERRKIQYYTIYKSIFQDSRIYIKDITAELNVNPRTTTKRMQEASKYGIVVGPHIRKQSYKNMKEFMYFVDNQNPFETYLQYSKDNNVVYHARMLGFVSTWIVSNVEIDVEGDVLFKGLRSDFYAPFTILRSWQNAFEIMKKKIEKFNPKNYEPTGIIKTHWNESIEWDTEDEKLFREFKYNLRKSITPVMKRNLISSQKIYEFLERLPECCNTSLFYYPGGVSAYDPYLFMFETDYEDFIIELFSELPTTPFFFKVSDKLFMYAFAGKELLRCNGTHMANIGQLQIPLLTKELLGKDIIRREKQAIVAYHWSKAL